MTPAPNQKGLNLVRYTAAILFAKGDPLLASTYARNMWPGSPIVAEALKATVGAGTPSGAGWADDLVYSMAQDFIEAVRARSVIDRLVGVRRVPFRIQVPKETSGTGGVWVGSGAPIPLSKSALDMLALESYKAAALIALSNELVKDASSSSLEAMRLSMVNGVAEFLDGQFLTPTLAESAGVNPASVLYGAQEVVQTGVTASAILTDLGSLIDALDTFDAPVFVMRRRSAVAIHRVQAAAGGTPTITALGGMLLGIPVITSNATPTEPGSPTSTASYIALIDAASVLLADEGRADIETSRVASLQMDDAPTNNAETGTGTSTVSMFQTATSAIRVIREIAWKLARSGASAFMRVTY